MKNWPVCLWKLGEPEICLVGWRAGEELEQQPESKGSLLAEFPLSWERSAFFSCKPFH